MSDPKRKIIDFRNRPPVKPFIRIGTANGGTSGAIYRTGIDAGSVFRSDAGWGGNPNKDAVYLNFTPV